MLLSGGIQMWPFLTMQPHVSRVFPRVCASNSFSPPRISRSHQPIQVAKQMTLETNERRQQRRLSFVRAGTHGIQPPSGCPPITGKGIEKYRWIFVSVSQTLLLNGSRDAYEGML